MIVKEKKNKTRRKETMKSKKFLELYHKNKLGKRKRNGNYLVEGGRLLYTGSGRHDKGKWDETLAVTLKNGTKIYNAAQLKKCGTYNRGTQAKIQKEMQELKLPMIPLNVFIETGLDIEKARITEQGRPTEILAPKQVWSEQRKDFIEVNTIFHEVKSKKPGKDRNKETIQIEKRGTGWKHTYRDLTRMERRHFVGAMLIKIGKKTFLFDIDRKEAKHHRVNAFLTQVRGNPKTIKEAYEKLKPEEVKKAEREGKKVQRQGEWFFIPEKKAKDKIEKRKYERPEEWQYDVEDVLAEGKEGIRMTVRYNNLLPKYRKQLEKRVKEFREELKRYKKGKGKTEVFEYGGEIKAGNNRPNIAQKMAKVGKDTYVKGKIEHSGREHETIYLKEWHKAITNTAIGSFTIQGNVD